MLEKDADKSDVSTSWSSREKAFDFYHREGVWLVGWTEGLAGWEEELHFV